MRQVIFIDVYFILNYMANMCLITLTAFFRQKYRFWKRYVLASLLSAGIAAGILLLFYGNEFILACSVLPQILFLIRISFPFEGSSVFIKDCIAFFILTCLAGGTITALSNVFASVKGITPAAAITAGSALFLAGAICLRFELLLAVQKQKNVYLVKIRFHQEEMLIKALYDTGNQLISPYTGERVVLISKDLAEQLCYNQEKILWIPYSSIGGTGLLQAFRIDAMEIIEKGEKKENVLVAISDSFGKSSEIKMILNLM